MDRDTTRWIVTGVAALVVVGAVAGVAAFSARARVTGETVEERIDSIGMIADDRPWGAGDALAEAAAGEDSPAVRRAALIGLGRLADSDYRPVIDEASRHEDPQVRGAAASALGFFGDEVTLSRLGEMVADDDNERVRMEALEGLGRSPARKATALLFLAMEKNDNPKVQVKALHVLLRRLSAAHSSPPRPGTQKWHGLVEFIRQVKPVAEALKSIGEPGGEAAK